MYSPYWVCNQCLTRKGFESGLSMMTSRVEFQQILRQVLSSDSGTDKFHHQNDAGTYIEKIYSSF
jgi:hypothetical protein